jgi:hypothetical protein
MQEKFGIPRKVVAFFFFFRFPNLFAVCIDTFKYNQQMVCLEGMHEFQFLRKCSEVLR